jgi:putative membrane protein
VEAPDSRFTQANERTFLAWIRTAHAVLGVGLAIEHNHDNCREARMALSVPLILLGGFLGVAGYVRWRTAETAIRRREDLPPSRIPALLAVTFVLLMIGALVLVIVSDR